MHKQAIAIIPYSNLNAKLFRTIEFYYNINANNYAFRVYDISFSGEVTYPDTVTVIMFYYDK